MEIQEAKHRLTILIENDLLRAFQAEQEVGSSFPMDRAINRFVETIPEWAEVIPNVKSFIYKESIKARTNKQRADMAYRIGEEKRKRKLRLMENQERSSTINTSEER